MRAGKFGPNLSQFQFQKKGPPRDALRAVPLDCDNSAVRLLLHAFASLILLLILTQDYQIFAEKMLPLLGRPPREFQAPPPGEAADGFVRTLDSQQIHYRRWQGQGAPRTAYRVAVLHHGNLGTMDGYRTIPKWLAGLGITSYVYDYRGYGQSTGFPSERGLYRDAEAVLDQALRNEGASPEVALAFAHSLGGGPATYLAAKKKLGALILAASFTSVPDAASTNPSFGWLSRFAWTRFPNAERIAELDRTCLIVLHAGQDKLMPRWMSRQLAHAYRGRGRSFLTEGPNASHDSIVTETPALAEPLLHECSKN